jgi:hypothetical protein
MQARPEISATDNCKAGARICQGRIAALARAAIHWIALLLAALAIGVSPAWALDDREFCVSAQQLALAAEKDVGVWIDRQTRNAGMVVACDKKTVQFTRFTYAPSASMNEAWKERKAADWNAVHCNSAIWKGAIANGWKIVLSQTAADGGQATITAQCGK